MQTFEQTVKQKPTPSNNITLNSPKALLCGEAASALIDKLVYATKLANDHILHELEARYGAVVAQYLMEKMPK